MSDCFTDCAGAARGSGVVAEGRTALLAPALLLAMLPLFTTPVFPFIDYYAHAVRHHVLALIGREPALDAQYDAAWRLLPNLGLDVIGAGLMRLVPPLEAAWLAGALTAAAPVAGVLLLARALHGRVRPETAVLAGILAYNHILVWGFANFLLALGAGFGALALWVALRDRPGPQLAAAVAVAPVLMLAHGFAFALWGLLLGALELGLAREARDLSPRRLARRVLRLLAVGVLPVALFLQMPTADAKGGASESFGNLAGHAREGRLADAVLGEIAERTDVFLRVADSGWITADRWLGAVLWALLLGGLAAGALRLDRRLVPAALLAALLCLVTPPVMFGVGYVSDRMPLVLLALLAAGVSVVPGTAAGRRVALALATLFVVRVALTAAGWHADGQTYRAFLTAIGQHDTGRLAATVWLDGSRSRDWGRSHCAPLASLTFLRNGTAVSTFSHPTQQPIRLAGALAAARARYEAIPFATLDRDRSLAAVAEAGFDTVIACGTGPAGPPPPGLRLVAAREPWALYRAVPRPDREAPEERRLAGRSLPPGPR